MRPVVIVGSGGAGKSTLARRLAAITGLPLLHLDREYWRPGWCRPPSAQWRARVDEIVAGEAWISDGNFSSTMERRFAAADTIVLLDLPPWLCAWRALRRAVTGRGRRRPDLADGCDERIDLEFLRWVWSYRRVELPKVMARIAARWRSASGASIRSIPTSRPRASLGATGHQIGVSFKDEGRLDEALPHYRRAVEILEAALGRDHTDVGNALLGLGLLQLERGAKDDALAVLERAHGLLAPSELPPATLAECRWALARLLVARDRARARALAEQAAAGFRPTDPTRADEIAAWLAAQPV